MMWSKHSSRIDPINRSAKAFYQGEAGAIGLSRMPLARDRRVTAEWVARQLTEAFPWDGLSVT